MQLHVMHQRNAGCCVGVNSRTFHSPARRLCINRMSVNNHCASGVCRGATEVGIWVSWGFCFFVLGLILCPCCVVVRLFVLLSGRNGLPVVMPPLGMWLLWRNRPFLVGILVLLAFVLAMLGDLDLLWPVYLRDLYLDWLSVLFSTGVQTT